jgi:hypothetical protein
MQDQEMDFFALSVARISLDFVQFHDFLADARQP